MASKRGRAGIVAAAALAAVGQASAGVVSFHSAFHFQDVLRDTPLPQRAPTSMVFYNASDSTCAEKFYAMKYTPRGMPERKDLLMGRYDIEDQYHYAWFDFTAAMDLPKRLEITRCPELVVFHPEWTGRENNSMDHVRRWDGTGDWRLWVRAQLAELPDTTPHDDWPQDRLAARDSVESRTHMRISKVPALLPKWSELGYKKMPMPPGLFEDIQNFYDKHIDKRAEEIWDSASTQLNQFEAKMTMVKLDHDFGERDKIANVHVKPILAEWTGIPVEDLTLNAVYGIREYYRGNELRTHIDVIKTHVISAILNFGQEDLDEEWPLEVINHKGVRENITMKPKEMILYESTTTPHGRPFAFKGGVFRNIFVHYSPKGWDFVEDTDGVPFSPTGFMGYGKKVEEPTAGDEARSALTRAQFQNRSPQELSLYWDGPDGPVLQSAIKANEELLLDTYEGHNFFWSSGSPDSKLGEHKVDGRTSVFTHYGGGEL